MVKKQRGGEWSINPMKWFSSTAADVRDVAVSAAPAVVKPVATDKGTAKLADTIGKPFAPEGAGKTMTGGRRTRKHRKHAKKTHRRRR
jgi:hypothetical protein